MIVDFVGQGYFQQNLASAAKDGRMVMLGLLSGAKTAGPVDLSQLLYKRMRIEGTVSALLDNGLLSLTTDLQTLRSRTTEYQTNLLQRFSKDALPKLLKGHYELVIHEVRPSTYFAATWC